MNRSARRQIAREEIPDGGRGPHWYRDYSLTPCFRHVDNLVLSNTVFSVR